MHNTQKNKTELKKRRKKLSELGNEENIYLTQKKYKKEKSTNIRTLKQFLLSQSFPLKNNLKGSNYLHKRYYHKQDIGKYNKVKIPKFFSFSQNPNETILKLRQVASSMLRITPHTIMIDFAMCEEMDLAACCVLSSILLSASGYFEEKGINLLAKGISLQTEVGQMLVISGLIEHLNFEGKGEKEEKAKEGKILLPLLTEKEYEFPVEEIITYLSDCLDAEDWALTSDGNQMMGDIIGEVFSNIDDHNKGFKKWYAIGHATPTESNTIVHLTIMNYGVSFYESFQQEDTKPFGRSEIEHLIRQQNQKKIDFNEEVYVTLLCLQKNISRCKDNERSTRGQGLIELLDNLMKIGEYNKDNRTSIMSITTGGVSIFFDGEEIIDKKQRVYLGKNFDYLRSKEKYFRKLSYKFPGTVISMKFTLNRKYIEGVIGKNGEN